MASPLTTVRNNYASNRKDNQAETPADLGAHIVRRVDTVLGLSDRNGSVIFDPAAGSGAFLRAAREVLGDKAVYAGIDIGGGIIADRLAIVRDDFFADSAVRSSVTAIEEAGRGSLTIAKPDLVVLNPPFNVGQSDREYWKGHPAVKEFGTRLLPDLFLRRIWQIWGTGTRVAVITPAGFFTNQRRGSERRRFYAAATAAEITGVTALPLDTFEGVEFPMCALYFNIWGISPFDWWVSEKEEVL